MAYKKNAESNEFEGSTQGYSVNLPPYYVAVSATKGEVVPGVENASGRKTDVPLYECKEYKEKKSAEEKKEYGLVGDDPDFFMPDTCKFSTRRDDSKRHEDSKTCGDVGTAQGNVPEGVEYQEKVSGCMRVYG